MGTGGNGNGLEAVIVMRLPPLWMSLNGKQHFRYRAPVEAQLKQEAHWEAMRALAEAPGMREQLAYRLHWTFVVPDRRRRDTSNMFAACKHLEDGIAMALGVDDEVFRYGTIDRVVVTKRRYAIVRLVVEDTEPTLHPAIEQAMHALPPNVNALTAAALDTWGRKKDSRANITIVPGSKKIR